MDYIGELLLRQKAALEGLVLGRGTAAEEKEEIPAAEEAVFAREQQEGYRNKKTAVYRTKAARTNVEAALGEEEAIRAGAEERSRGWESVEENMARKMMGFLPETSIAWEEVGPAGCLVDRRSDAKALSRTIQRDARRYDGGFSIY